MCEKYGKVGAVVLNLVETLPKNVEHKVYMDLLFSSINLFNYLKQQGIWAVGIISNNRLYGADKLMQNPKKKKKNRKKGGDLLTT